MAIELALAEENPDAKLADGFSDALVGICYQFGRPSVAAYDYDMCIEILMRDGIATREDAEEFFEFNVVGAYVGEGTPVFLKII